MTLLRKARRFFAGRDHPSSREAFRRQTGSFPTAQIVVRCYYVVLLFFGVAIIHDWSAYLDRLEAIPLWPVCWLRVVPLRAGILGILIGYPATTFLGAVFPRQRWARLLAFLGLFEFVAMDNSFGKINHSNHLWVLTAFVLVFLPNVTDRMPDRATRQRFLTIFWACQAITLLTYTMSGIGKAACAIYQLCAGQNNILMPTGLAAIVASRLLQTNSSSWLGPWLVAHPWFGWPLGLVSTYMELFAFWIAFRPALLRWWAAGLILFHIGVFLCMGINFLPVVPLLGLLFLAAPPCPEERSALGVVRQLPVVSQVLRWAHRGLYSGRCSVYSKSPCEF
jgi:hypothetical protein